MYITLTKVGKRFNREWIFLGVDFTFIPGKKYAITGPNGSGKSTLLQVIAGTIMQTAGSIVYTDNNHENTVISPGKAYGQISFASPYLELIEEMTASEMLKFHASFKPLTKPVADILSEVSLETSAHKQIRYFSSGMKQRLKLAQAFFCRTPVLLFDEPVTNLDEDGIILYHHLIKNYGKEKTIIVSSNDKQEYDFCEEVINIGNFK